MKGIWTRIPAWLDANAPAGYGQLRAGATAPSLRAAEEAMGVKLPGDVEASYSIHDGQDKEPGLIGGEGWRLLSLHEMVEQWECWSKLNPRNARYVPIAWNEAGDYVIIDSDSDKPGCRMIQRHDTTEPDPLAPSFSIWLTDFADQLEDGAFAYSESERAVIYSDDLELD